MHIRSLLVMWKETQYIGTVLKTYSDVLMPGNYYIYNSFRAMCLQDPKIRASADLLFQMKNPYRARAKTARILNKVRWFHNRNKKSSGEYEAFYIANNEDAQREVKLFSFQRKQVLSICKNTETMQKQLQEYQQLSRAYPMPRAVKNHRYPTALDVDMVQCKPSAGDGCALTAIAKATAANNPDPAKLAHKSVEELTTFAYDDERMNRLLKALRDRIDPEFLSLAMPLCFQHGDLSKDNLLYGESGGVEDYWFIDWEHARDRVFFYDYFFYILNPGIYGDMGGLHCYLSGENDETLQAFLAHFGWEFRPDKRVDYFLMFAICFLKERVCDLGNFSTLERYCDFIDKHCRCATENGGAV